MQAGAGGCQGVHGGGGGERGTGKWQGWYRATSIFLSAAMMSKVCATPSFCVTVHVIDPCSPSRPSSEAPSLRMDMAFSYLVRVAMLVGG